MIELWYDLNDRHATPEIVKAVVSELLAYREAQGKPVAWISERNLKNLGKQFSVYVKHEPVMVRPIPLFTAPQLRHVADDEQADREFNSLDTL